MNRLQKVVLSGLLLLGACSPPPSGQAAEPSGKSATDAVQAPSPEAQVAGLLGNSGSLAQDHSPNILHGDFDGDGAPDLLAVVTVRGMAGDLPAGVHLVLPWPPNAEVVPSDNLAQGSRVGLLVIPAAGNATEAYLLHDANPISILDTEAALELSVVPHSELSALEEPELENRARGDVIVVPTEAGIDTYLYWDGSTYRSFEPAEEP